MGKFRIANFIIVFLILISLCACSSSKPEKVAGSFFNLLEKKDIEKAVSLISFTQYSEIGLKREDLIVRYEDDIRTRGFELHKYKILYSDKDNAIASVFLITSEKWTDEGTENQLYFCDLKKINGKWKIVEVGPVEGVPMELINIFQSSEDVQKYEF